MATVKVKGSARLFKNNILEALTRTNPLFVLGVYLPLSIAMAWYFLHSYHPSALKMTGLIIAGLFVWTFVEYIMHRYVFHFVNETAWAQRFHFFVHGVHHEYPKDKDRLVLPPTASIFIAVAFFAIFRLVLGADAYVFFSGFILGYLCYDMIHYILHAFRQPKNGMKFWWEYHNIHHFRHPDKAYGVSSPLWDMILGTYPPKKSTAKKQ